MRLIPDFEFLGHKISLQDPYTIDNELITECHITGEFEARGDRRIEIKKGTFGYSFNYYNFDGAIHDFAAQINTYMYEDETGRIFQNEIRNISQYIDHIKRQIERYERDRNSWTGYDQSRGADLNRLIRQGRTNNTYISSQEYRLVHGTPFTGTITFNNTISSFDSSISATSSRSVSSSSVTNATVSMLSEECRSALNNLISSVQASSNYSDFFGLGSKYIHAFNYKPEYKHHVLETELKTEFFPLLLGAEIEVAGNTDEKMSREDVVKKCIQIMNGSDSDREDLIYSTHDSSVQIELDTMPCSLEFHKTMNYKEMFEFLDKQGYKGHDCSSAGLHIHADRKYLGNTPLKQQLTISKILYIMEKFNDDICVIARRNSNYSQFVGNGKDENSIVELYGKYKDKGKHVALNLKHKESIEFRCFKSTLKYETFILTLEFVKDIIDYAKSINIEEIELMRWSDLMGTFSDELKEYYNERLEKEKNKKKDKVAFTNVQGVFVNGESLSVTPSSIMIHHPDSASVEFCNAQNNNNNNDSIKSLKNKIEQIKKKIKKNCNNYMERKKLNEELCKLQKELKKAKKNSRNNSVSTENSNSNLLYSLNPIEDVTFSCAINDHSSDITSYYNDLSRYYNSLL